MEVDSHPRRVEEQDVPPPPPRDREEKRNLPVFRLFVRNLSFDTNWKDLKDLMTKVGEVVYADIALDPRGRSRGYGVVDFTKKEDADRAIEEYDQKDFMGRQINVKLDEERERILFIGKLPYSFNWRQLKDLLSEQGPVKKTIIAEDFDGRSRGFGYALFHSKEDADLIKEKFNGYSLEGRDLIVHEDRSLKVKGKYFGPDADPRDAPKNRRDDYRRDDRRDDYRRDDRRDDYRRDDRRDDYRRDDRRDDYRREERRYSRSPRRDYSNDRYERRGR